MTKTENFEQIEVTSATKLRGWLLKIILKKRLYGSLLIKTSAEKYVSIDEVLDELLCFGWIDGIRRKLDLDRTMQLIAPRKVEH
jgi:hypothetical protein